MKHIYPPSSLPSFCNFLITAGQSLVVLQQTDVLGKDLLKFYKQWSRVSSLGMEELKCSVFSDFTILSMTNMARYFMNILVGKYAQTLS